MAILVATREHHKDGDVVRRLCDVGHMVQVEGDAPAELVGAGWTRVKSGVREIWFCPNHPPELPAS
jgi:hypothetical protein